LHKVLAQYPRDRVAINDLGRIQFLQRKYKDAIATLSGVLAIDPEDLQAQYNLMLCYSGLGDEKQAHDHQVRYLRFKADEASQTITGPYRQLHPEDNNERQAIHEHVSVSLPVLGQRRISKATGGDARHPTNHMSRAASRGKSATGRMGTAALGRSVERSSTYASMKSTGREVK
jgi:tetratricopeptide (TPR) repeat protein